MRKRNVFLVCVLVAIVGVVGAVTYSPSNIPFTYDPNQVKGMLLGGVSVEVGTYLVVDVNCTDSDPFTIVAINPPIGLYVINEGDVWRIEWTPDILQEGVWYITLVATDVPPPPQQSKSTESTIVIQVVSENDAPVFHLLKDDVISVSSWGMWPLPQQKKWQELRKQGTVIYGPVNISL